MIPEERLDNELVRYWTLYPQARIERLSYDEDEDCEAIAADEAEE